MKKRLKDFSHLEIARPELVKGGDGGTTASIAPIIIVDEQVGRG